jgi:hypothetical protein
LNGFFDTLVAANPAVQSSNMSEPLKYDWPDHPALLPADWNSRRRVHSDIDSPSTAGALIRLVLAHRRRGCGNNPAVRMEADADGVRAGGRHVAIDNRGGDYWNRYCCCRSVTKPTQRATILNYKGYS